MSEVEIDGLDDFVHGGSAPQQAVVMGITPENTPRPAFTLTPMPPRQRTRTMMVPQYEEMEVEEKDGDTVRLRKTQRLIGFKPVEKLEEVSGGYMLRAMKGHSVFIDNIDQLKNYKLSQYVKMINPNDADGAVVSHVPLSAVVTRSTQKAA